MEFTRAVYAAGNVRFMKLHAINKPLDEVSVPFDGVVVESRDACGSVATVLSVGVVVIRPVNGSKDLSAGVDMFHYVELTARRPSNRSDVVSQQPERRPYTLK